MTPADLIPRAMRRAGILGTDEAISPEDMDTGFYVLNEMIDAWSIENLYLYQLVDLTTTAINGKASYTLGPGGDFDATRPPMIDQMIYTNGSIDYEVVQTTVEQYAAIPYKKTIGIPSAFAYEPSMPAGVISIYPIPIAGGTLKVKVHQLLSQFTALNQSVQFPPGYQAALRQALAVALCGEFSVAPSQELMVSANNAKRAIRRANVRVPLLNVQVTNAPTRNILAGFN
jgi:hypothetical protein